jgi:hypothetical protein
MQNKKKVVEKSLAAMDKISLLENVGGKVRESLFFCFFFYFYYDINYIYHLAFLLCLFFVRLDVIYVQFEAGDAWMTLAQAKK